MGERSQGGHRGRGDGRTGGILSSDGGKRAEKNGEKETERRRPTKAENLRERKRAAGSPEAPPRSCGLAFTRSPSRGLARPQGDPQFGAGAPAPQSPPACTLPALASGGALTPPGSKSSPSLQGMGSALRTGLPLGMELQAREPLPICPPGMSGPALANPPHFSPSLGAADPGTPRASRRCRETEGTNPGPEGRPPSSVSQTRSGVGPGLHKQWEIAVRVGDAGREIREAAPTILQPGSVLRGSQRPPERR